jgi:hypothetical protein
MIAHANTSRPQQAKVVPGQKTAVLKAAQHAVFPVPLEHRLNLV